MVSRQAPPLGYLEQVELAPSPGDLPKNSLRCFLTDCDLVVRNPRICIAKGQLNTVAK